MPTILLWLFVVNLGIAFGAGLYESRIAVPQWLQTFPGSPSRWNAAAAREANVGLRFWVYVTTIPLTLLTIASLEPPRGWRRRFVSGGGSAPWLPWLTGS